MTLPDPRWPSAADWLAAGPPAGVRPDLAFLGVPTFATSISPTGAHATPAAVRRALRRLSTWSASRRLDLAERLTAVDLGDVVDPDDDPDLVRAQAAAAAAEAPLAVLLGGDNALTAPAALGVFGADLGTADLGTAGLATAGLVTLDAHHDLREGRSNGSPVRLLLDAGLAAERVVQVGIADWANSRSYAAEAARRGITVRTRDEVATVGVERCVREALDRAATAGGPVYVDLDLDVCDRSVAPGCPASLPGGLSGREVLAAAHAAGRHPAVRAVDLTEVDATVDPDGRTTGLAALCVLEVAAGFVTRA